MCHNIRLPLHIISYFPLSKVRFGNLSGKLQHSLKHIFCSSLSQSDLLRPHQCTLPMGFKGEIFIAPTFATATLNNSINIFNLVSIWFFTVLNGIRPRMVPGMIFIRPADAVVLHIIDDVNVIANEWPKHALVKLQRLIYSAFWNADLPINNSKYLLPRILEETFIHFLGWRWDLVLGHITMKNCIGLWQRYRKPSRPPISFISRI